MKPIDLDAVRASRGDRDPLALVKALVEDFESGELTADEIAVVCVKHDKAGHGFAVMVRSALQRSAPYHFRDTLSLLDLGKWHLTNECVETWDE